MKKIMSTEENKAIIRRFYEELNDFMRTGEDISFLDRTFDKNMVQHISGFPPNFNNLAALKQMMPTFRTALPDLKMTAHDIIGEGDKVVSRVSWEGTHKGEMRGIPPSNKRLNVSEMHIYRFSNGKVVERWGEWDMFGMMQQIGIIPTTTTTTPASG
jgi:steroid delta-isomerase-like uncharacterized protein